MTAVWSLSVHPSRLPPPSRIWWLTSSENPQFLLCHRKHRRATVQTYGNVWKNPDDGLLQTFKSPKVEGHFAAECGLVI